MIIFNVGKYIFGISLRKFLFLKYKLVPDFDNKFKEHLWTDVNTKFWFPEKYNTFEYAMIKCKVWIHENLLEAKHKASQSCKEIK